MNTQKILEWTVSADRAALIATIQNKTSEKGFRVNKDTIMNTVPTKLNPSQNEIFGYSGYGGSTTYVAVQPAGDGRFNMYLMIMVGFSRPLEVYANQKEMDIIRRLKSIHKMICISYDEYKRKIN